MNLKGLIKESFKPTKIKLIIISLLILIFIFTIYGVYSGSNFVVSNLCEGYQTYIIPALNAVKSGDNETSEKLVEGFQERLGSIDTNFLYWTVEVIYPIYDKMIPTLTSFCLPIEFFLLADLVCKKSYISEENYECILSSLNEERLLLSEIHGTDIDYIEKQEYKQASYISHLPGIIILVIESYLVLSLLSFIFLLSKEKYYSYKLNNKFNKRFSSAKKEKKKIILK